jgi:gamma-glutamylcyclotransferase (GGCT)/AIG2-like uncharacterized protein YtfP
MEADGLFVYGTLREGGPNHAWLKRTHPAGVTAAWAPGRLFQLPEASFPAMVPGPIPPSLPPGPGWVVGEFVGYEDEADLDAALTDLDTLEGVADDLFERRLLPVLLASGQTYVAWVYLFPLDRVVRLEREGVELTEGDWGSFLA